MSGRTFVRWTGYVAVAIVFAVACAFLSNWQFARNDERSGQLALVERNYDATPVALADLIAPGDALAAGDEWHPVELVGEYLTDEQLLVRNRPHGGTSAFEVLVPFRTSDGRVLIIDRGWVPPGRESPEPDAVPAAPTGEVTVVARLRAHEAAPSSGRSAPAGQVPTINLGLIAEATDLGPELVDSAYGLLVEEDPAPAERPQPIAPPSEDPGPHLSYAIQWILFAIMGFVFIWYMIRTERRHRREESGDEADERPDAPAPASVSVVPAGLRGQRPAAHDRDMDDEDAILDRAGR